jgi:autotransporter strand-loop-strand O-heptosyltransferase
MLGNKFNISYKNDAIEIENLTSIDIENCLVSGKNIFSQSLIHTTFDFKPYETKTISLSTLLKDNFIDSWKNRKIDFKIYSNNRLIFEKSINDLSKCYVVISNDKFENIADKLISKLDEYSNVQILHYTIGYKSKLKYSNLTNIEFTIPGDPFDSQHMQFSKPCVFLDVLEKGYKNVVFIDADVQIRSNIDKVWEYCIDLEESPIFQRSNWDYVCVKGKYIPEIRLSKFLELPEKQKYPYFITNIVIFNQTHKDLFAQWKDICFADEIDEIRKSEFLHDEVILNSLMWKKEIAPKCKYFLINVADLQDVQFFYHYNFNGYEEIVDMNDYGRGHASQSYFPYDKSQIIGFHCIKDPIVAEDVNQFIYSQEKEFTFKENLISFYESMKLSSNRINEDYQEVKILNHYIDGPFIEIKCDVKKEFKVEFWNDDKLEYSTVLGSNMWARPYKKYFGNYRCKVYDGDELVFDEKFNPTEKRVYIAIQSSSLGDTLAWMPYAEEFRKKWNCHVVISTFKNELFIEQYPELEFVTPGTIVHNLYASYHIGWFYSDDEPEKYKTDRHPRDFKHYSLQQTSSDILGLDFKYVKPKLKIPQVEKKKRVGIGFHSTAQTKYWNNPTGWQEVVDFLNSKGYEPMIISREGDNYMGNRFPTGVTKLPEGNFDNLIKEMASCEFFIGIGSGLSWLAWALDLPIFLISGFSTPISEFEGPNIFRIFNDKVCNGCYNRYRLDAGDWNWCPDHKGTPRQFECTKQISGKMVIDEIKRYLTTKDIETVDFIEIN